MATPETDLTETDLLLLDTLIYSNKFYNATNDELGNAEGDKRPPQTIGALLQDEATFSGILNDTSTGGMRSDSWQSAIASIQTNDRIKDLTIQNVYRNESTGAVMACFTNSSGQAYVSFRGTGHDEWTSDVSGLVLNKTTAQVEAYNWFIGLPYDHVIVTGHSNGGNKAMFITVRLAQTGFSSKISSCLAFDAQGFSRSFMQENLDGVKASFWKIHSIGNYQDMVGPLLCSPAGNQKYLSGSSTSGISHVLDALFHFDTQGTIRLNPLIVQDAGTQFIHELSVYLTSDGIPTGEQGAVIYGLGRLLTMLMGEGKGFDLWAFNSPDKVDIKDFIDDETMTIAPQLLLKYAAQFIAELKERDLATYQRYRFGMVQYLQTLGLSNAKAYAIWKCLEEGNILPYPSPFNGESGIADITNKERDFTQATKERLLNNMRTKTDALYRNTGISHLGLGSVVMRYNDAINTYNDEYRRTLSEFETELERAFQAVEKTDRNYAEQMSELANDCKDLGQTLGRLADSVG